jgi:hypothetical protein
MYKEGPAVKCAHYGPVKMFTRMGDQQRTRRLCTAGQIFLRTVLLKRPVERTQHVVSKEIIMYNGI